jgi:zinc/manganese transport system substrate-binding protein
LAPVHSRRRLLTAAAFLAMPALGGCAGAPAPHDRVRVVAVERVYGDVARQLGGAAVEVTTILDSPSADPHDYEPTTRDADAISDADVVIENGLGYDAFADHLLAASPNADRTLVNVGMLGDHRLGDNPHVWYEMRSLRRLSDALANDLARRKPAARDAIDGRRAAFDAWIGAFSARLATLAKRREGTRVAITEPVFDYVLHAAHLDIATPAAFSHAIEEGNDPAPQDVDAMRALIGGRGVAAFVYNAQTVEPSTTNLLALAASARVAVVPVTETLPPNETTQAWMDRELCALARAL